MNSVEGLSTYDLNFAHRQAYKTAATTYDFPEHSPSTKKDRKWSFGNLFRRKKKDDSDSSSEDDQHKRNFLNRKKNKCDKRKKPVKSISGAFDHIVSPPSISSSKGRQPQLSAKGAQRTGSSFEDAGILSDPSGYFDSYIGRPLPRLPTNEVLHAVNKQQEKNRSHNSLGSADSLSKKSRKERTKARAVARRDSINHRSSSDEDDSQRSCSSSRFRSDESLAKHRDVSASRRSRMARTERYIRRLSKDDESILNREAMQRQARENWQLMNEYTPGDYCNQNQKVRRASKHHRQQQESYNCNYSNPCASNESMQNFSGLFTIPPSHSNLKYRNSNSHMQQMNHTYDDLQGSRLSINQPPFHAARPNNNSTCFNIRSLSCDSNIHKSPSPDEIRTATREAVHIRNLDKQPPPPPPRDPRRVMYHPNNHCVDLTSNQLNPKNELYRRSQFIGYRTCSEDVIPTYYEKGELQIRPASVSNETRKSGLNNLPQLAPQNSETFKYMTEKRPRSRKPIFIQSTDRINMNHFNAPTATTINSSHYSNQAPPAMEEGRKSPQMFTAQTHVQSKVFLPSTVIANNESIAHHHHHDRQISPFVPITLPATNSNGSISIDKNDEPSDEIKRKSANLEEALDELEAIYKSLHLGDEDLLERAEQRELSIATQKMLDSKNETYTGISRGAMSDSSFSYEPFNALNMPKKEILKKARTLDRKSDDMAFRKMNMEQNKSNTGNSSTLKSLANVSYLLASPVHFEMPSLKNDDFDECDGNNETNKSEEPDVTLDDVVYRIVKHANNTLKIPDPQPPFGIPIGPVPPSSNSDYLHAVPENVNYMSFVKNKIPDVVKDDLAFRNLRKDNNKEPALKPVTPTDFDNVTCKETKRKRAVRSLSANISNLMNQEQNKTHQRTIDCENEFRKTQLTDIADAMEIARQILKEKETRIQATRRAFLSDSDTKYRRDGISASSTETITESRLNFLNEMRSIAEQSNNQQIGPKSVGDHFLPTKPPRGATPDRRLIVKESTPTPASPADHSCKDSLHSSFEELLTALAVEARETSDRITNELNTLEDSLKPKENLQNQIKEIDSVSEHTTLCEKLRECVVESTELIASTNVESNMAEQVEQIENLAPESIANIVTTRIELSDEAICPVDIEVHSSTEQDYDNLIPSDLDMDLGCEDAVSKSPFEEHKAELIAHFQEMKDPINNEPTDVDMQTSNVETTSEGGEPFADSDLNVANINTHVASALPDNIAFVSEFSLTSMLQTSEQDEMPQHDISFTTNCDIFIDDYSIDGDDDDDKVDDDLDTLPSSGFHSNTSDAICASNRSLASNLEQIPDHLLVGLESPKLVTSAMKMTEHDVPSTSSTSENAIRDSEVTRSSSKDMIPFNADHDDSKTMRRQSNLEQTCARNAYRSAGRISRSDDRICSASSAKTRTWYGDPIVLAFACSYGVACSYQLATLDVVTILGIVFVIISLAAALLLE